MSDQVEAGDGPGSGGVCEVDDALADYVTERLDELEVVERFLTEIGIILENAGNPRMSQRAAECRLTVSVEAQRWSEELDCVLRPEVFGPCHLTIGCCSG